VEATDSGLEATLDLWDYRRRVADLYTRLRAMDPVGGHGLWTATRDQLFRTHSQSPLPAQQRDSFPGLVYWPYDPSLRTVATVEVGSGQPIALAHSGEGATAAHLFGRAHFRLANTNLALDMYWLDDYAGGVFMPFKDETNGVSTYGGGRYLLDTAKGADLGHDGDGVIVDFNFAYHPSCAHNPQWSCPLAPPGSRLPIAIRGGERLPQ
jgi:uncharacterized protein